MTPSQNTLALGLLLTLCSNAVLLMLLLLQLRSGGENGSGFSGGCGVVGSEGAGFAKDVTVNIVPGGDLSESLSIDTGQETGADSLGLTAQFEDRRNSYNGGDTSKSLSREHPEKGDSFAQGANTFSYSPQLENTDEESLPKWAYTGTSPRHLPDKIAHIFKEYADTGKFPREAYTSSSPLLARLVSGHVMKTTLRSLSKVSERITKLSQSVNQFDEPRYRFRPRTRPDADQTGFQTHNIESRVNTNGDSDLKITHKSTGMETVAANSHRNKYKLKQSSISKSQNSTIHSLKLRRRRDIKETKPDSADERSYEQILADAIPLEEVFPTLTESELQKFSPPVSEILVPALIHFEGMMVRQIEMLNDAMVSLDLRLETLENSKLDWYDWFSCQAFTKLRCSADMFCCLMKFVPSLCSRPVCLVVLPFCALYTQTEM
ncbi:uncharacterized protein LOC101854779 [Aplysia californica]|uniref:Uncharacterized protein LOC101854779 n=1 Tax=Aplysia californica TaxID=6500 RepID=A0ABM0ZUR8_APLCA|nr:uncharacterized protein LOC101854779 [Aplysia californica]